MSLKYFTDQFHAKLRRAAEANLERYKSPGSWVESCAGGSIYCRDTGVAAPTLRPLIMPDGSEKRDLENAQIVYEDLKALDTVQATDERLWAWLAHVQYWEYMTQRWGLEDRQREKPVQFIHDRYFLRTHGIGSLVRHGIARLWWFGYLTHDPKRNDPYELTKILLSSQDIQTGLLQRGLGKNRDIRTAALQYFAQRADQIETLAKRRGGVGRVAQHLCKGLNFAGGVYLLDALQQPQLHGILDDSLAEFAE
jgi:hypothetical protein